jgi:hypothetical protein
MYGIIGIGADSVGRGGRAGALRNASAVESSSASIGGGIGAGSGAPSGGGGVELAEYRRDAGAAIAGIDRAAADGGIAPPGRAGADLGALLPIGDDGTAPFQPAGSSTACTSCTSPPPRLTT